MTIWEVQGYLPSIETSPIMKQHEWLVIANSFEEAIDKAHKRGARNIFNVTESKIKMLKK